MPIIPGMEEQLSKPQSAADTAVAFINRLEEMHRSKAYVTIRDEMTSGLLKAIRGYHDPELYKRFQAIRQEAKQSWDYDHKTATMEDVNRACTNVYGMVIKLLQAETSSFDPVLNKLGAAINTIEERLGMPQTKWIEEDHNDGDADGTDTGNVQGITPSGE